MKQACKALLLAGLSALTRRPAVLLAPEAAGDDRIIRLRTTYRVEGPTLDVTIEDPADGHLTAALSFGASRAPVWTSGDLACAPGARLTLSLADGAVRFRDRLVGRVREGAPITARRLSWQLTLTGNGVRRTRSTGHYLARDASHPVDEQYFAGDDYIDYEMQSAAVHGQVAALARAHGMTGPVLEIGAATGATLSRLRETGFDVAGVDFSPWAVEQAEARLGQNVVHWCDVEREPLPVAVRSRAPFGVLLMANVFEHFSSPFEVLERLGQHMRRGAHLILITTNADSLTRRLFGSDWEGHFDWTHRGVHQVSAASVRRHMPPMGWQIASLRTWHVWDGDADPTKATLREWCAADARFRRLLEERDLGDFLECVAVRG